MSDEPDHRARNDDPPWQAVDALLDELLDAEPPQRAEILARVQASDADLAARAQRLLSLALDQQSLPDSLNTAAPDLFTALAEQDVRAHIGERLGPYRIANVISRGGMGIVFRGERADGVFEQEVAIKLIPASIANETARVLFERERQYLARLEHPNIARIIDAGITQQDTPYYVMEYIDGKPINAYVRDTAGSRSQILEFFLQLCEAIAYCHRSMIVHGDIKPANVMIADGRVRVLDFGIGQLVDEPGRSQQESGVTAYTPGFAAPELERGEPATIESDIYALGAVLRLLFVETAGSIPPDISAITDCCLSKDPVSRYDSVDRLRDDIRNHLEHYPVSARTPTRRYRASRFVRRNRLLVGTSAAVVLALSTGLAAALWQYDVASTEASRAEQVKKFLASLFDAANPFGAWKDEKSVQDLLDYASDRIEAELAGKPEVLAEMQNLLGVAQIGNGQYQQARDMLAESLATRTLRFGADSLPVAEAANNLAWAHIELGQYEQAITHAERSLAIYEARLGRQSVEAAAAMTNLAAAHSNAGDRETAKALHSEALDIRRALLPTDHTDIADSMMSLATVHAALGERDAVLPLNEEAHRIYTTNYGEDHPMSVRAMNGIASGAFLAQDYGSAATAFRQLLKLSEQRLGAQHPELALYCNNLGRALTEIGDLSGARRMLARAAQIVERGHPQRMLTISVQFNYATVLIEFGELDEARARLDDATTQFIAVLGDAHPVVARARVQSARLDALEGESVAAIDELGELVAVLGAPGSNQAWLAEAQLELARLLNAQGRRAQAEALLAVASPAFSTSFSDSSWRRLDFELQQAIALGQHQRASERHARLAEMLPENSARLDIAPAHPAGASASP